jgi:hypothetical protein
LPGAPSIAQFAMGGNETITQPSPLSLHLNLRLQVYAVILSAAKNPEELNTSQPLGPFYHDSFPLCLCLSFINEANEQIHNNKVQLN